MATPPTQLTWQQIVKRVRTLNEAVLGDNRKLLQFEWVVPRTDGASITINDRTGSCEVTSWKESHHNGDHYDTQHVTLSPTEAHDAMLKVLARLEKLAVAKLVVLEEVEQKRAAELRARERLQKMLEAVEAGAPTFWDRLID